MDDDEQIVTRPATISAAAYVRMSTDVQNHSIQHQLDRIHAYSLARGLVIARTFVDEGRSGLTLANRPGLQSLLAEVTGEGCGFSVIVVYDVSRWGRFQDIDESAHYEYLCRRAGVSIVYCAEQFVDDGSPMHALMKNIKRIMAAEYSRELSAKVLLAQCRFSRMGYKQGGRPGFGLRRLPVASDGRPREPLLPGERKPMPTDRVALTHGIAEEVALVRRIYSMYTLGRLGDSDIARVLRQEGRLNHMGKPWDAATVRRVLTNRRYCGELVFNQTTRRMGTRVAANPEQLWISCDHALEAMIERSCFDEAQRVRAERAAGPDRDTVLANLRALYRKHGTINMALCADPSLPGQQAIGTMFGGYIQAYAAAGLPALHTVNGSLGYRTMRGTLLATIAEVRRHAVLAGGSARDTAVWNVLLLNDSVTVKVSIASCRRYPDSWHRWRIALRVGTPADFVLCAMMDRTNTAIDRYLLLSTLHSDSCSMHLSERTLDRYAQHFFAKVADMFGPL